jgi:putative heme transporter
MLPFGLAVLLAFIIEPLVAWATAQTIRGKEISRVAAVLGLYIFVAAVAYVFISLSLPQFGREIAKIGDTRAKIVENIKSYSSQAFEKAERIAAKNNLELDRGELQALVNRNVEGLVDDLRHNATKLLTFGKNIVAAVFVVVFGSFLVLMLTAFISIGRQRIEDFAISMVPPEYHDSYDSIAAGITNGLAGVVRGQVMICLTNGILTLIGLLIMGVRFPFLLATLAAVFSLIPIFGSIISTIPIVLVALAQSMTLAVFSLLWIIGIHLLEANFLNPKIMGDAAKIHPVIVVFVLVVGEHTAGLMGALFAVPIASVVLTFFKFVHHRAIKDVPQRKSRGVSAV